MEECLRREESGRKEETSPDGLSEYRMLRDIRLAKNETQRRFWGRFGVTQTRGSRFELGQGIPPPVEILLRLYLDGLISDGDLWRVRRRQRILTSRPITIGVVEDNAMAKQ